MQKIIIIIIRLIMRMTKDQFIAVRAISVPLGLVYWCSPLPTGLTRSSRCKERRASSSVRYACTFARAQIATVKYLYLDGGSLISCIS